MKEETETLHWKEPIHKNFLSSSFSSSTKKTRYLWFLLHLLLWEKQRTNIERIKKSNKGLYKTKQNIMTVPYVYWRIKSPFESKRKVLSLFLSFNRRKRKYGAQKRHVLPKKWKYLNFFSMPIYFAHDQLYVVHTYAPMRTGQTLCTFNSS